MLDHRFLTLTAVLCAVGAAPAAARMDHAAPACAAPAALPAELASWRSPTPLTAGRDRKSAAKAALTPGQAAVLTLSRTPDVRYPLRPEKPGGTVSFGGLATFTVKEAGTWRVALGAGAWVDVVKDGKAALSAAHGHGPDCTGVRKMVDYKLTPGSYTLQLAANAEDTLTVLVTRLP
ncbi:hypothetical protein [Novosphingobium sp. AP12]|uniref:hypothetical protein n=1 Tax=Novosphingobium sp. AP12 TaxID=1144305 RepID=UPI0002720B3D|nr:hypothetical protein [Novosphingobium sp. AP12]EJL22619.1 hypothetical protein PMI02_04515 [Novosphingobium sp. AP12]